MGSLPSSEEEIAALVEASQQILTNTYLDMSAICLLVYDVLINLDREIEFVWNARWSISKVLFIFGRYYGLLYNILYFVVNTRTDISLGICKSWLWYDMLGGELLLTTIVNVILTMRLYAVYQNHRVSVILILLIICEFALELYTCITLGLQTTRNILTIPSSVGITIPGCLTEVNLTVTLFAWVPCMVVATVFFTMTIVKAISEGWAAPKWILDVRRLSPLIAVILRDGALFYCMIIVILLVNTVLSLKPPNPAASSGPMPWNIAIYSLTASRLVLNLREEASRTRYGGVPELTTLDPIVFAMSPISNRPEGVVVENSVNEIQR